MLDVLSTFLQGHAANALAWTLIHFLRQGMLCAGVLWLALRLIDKQRAALRYAVACTVLAARRWRRPQTL